MKKIVNYDVSEGNKTFTEFTASEKGTVLLAATANNLSADAVFTPLIGPNDNELIEYTDGNFTIAAGATFGSIILSNVPAGSVQQLKCTVSGTGIINSIQIGVK